MQKNRLRAKKKSTGLFFDKNGSSTRATNFVAEIIAETMITDVFGSTTRMLELKITFMGDESIIKITFEEFKSGDWIFHHIGIDAEINPDLTKKDVCEIIKKVSKNKVKRIEIEKLGIHMLNGIPTFLHAGGAISPGSKNLQNVRAIPQGNLANCSLLEVSDLDNEAKLVKQMLRIRNISKSNPSCGASLLSCMTRAPLNHFQENSVVLVYVGESGVGKTAISLVAQAAYGKNFTEPPANWNSTAKSSELVAQQANHILLLIDDFTAAHANKETDKVAEYIIGGASNHTSHGYALSSTKAASPPKIEAFIIMTAEVIPPMEGSRKARCAFCQLLEDDIDFELLTILQKNAKRGTFAKVMGLYIQYLLDNYDHINNNIEKIINRYRNKAFAELNEDCHSRAPFNVADLIIGTRYFLKFCIDKQYITKDYAEKILDSQWSILIDLINSQTSLYNSAAPQALVEEELSLLFKNKIFTICEIVNKKMISECDIDEDDFLGWYNPSEKVFYIKSSFKTRRIIEQLPENIRALISTGSKSFWSNMKRYGLLTEVDSSSGKNYVRRTINGIQYNVYSLKYSLLD